MTLMRKVVKITFINSADYDFFEMNLDGDVAVYGKNDAGKSTCARAGLFGEHGRREDMNFASGESFDYYLHKGDKDGMLVYDYEDVTDGAPAVPYCLIITQRSINFVMARFSKTWVIDENGNLIVDWAGIRTRIENAEGDVKVYAVSSLRNLGVILQGAYDGSDHQMRYMCNRFSLFAGNGKNYSASAKIIASLWKNGAMGQDDIKRIIIDRAEANNTLRMDREPAFAIEAARNFAESFEDGWSDFKRYLSGELGSKMNQIEGSLDRYDAVQTDITRYPSVVGTAYRMKKEQLASLSTQIDLSKETFKSETNKYNALNDVVNKNKNERVGKIAIEKNNIDNARAAYNKFSGKDWVKKKADVQDLARIGTLNSEIEALKRLVENLRQESDSIVGPLRENLKQLEISKKEFIFEKTNELLAINDEKEKDKRIDELNEKIRNVSVEVDPLFEERNKSIQKTGESLVRAEISIKKNKEVIELLSQEDALFEQFTSESASFVPQGFQKTVIAKFFRAVVIFVCRHIFGINAFSKKELQELKEQHNKDVFAWRDEKEKLQVDIENKKTELRKDYGEQLSVIILEYKKRTDAANNAIKERRDSFESQKAEIEKQIASALESSGFNAELLKTKEDELGTRQRRFEYLTSNQENINQWKIVLENYDKIGEWETTKHNLEMHDKECSQKENKQLSDANALVTKAKETLDELDKKRKVISGEVNNYENYKDELSKVSGWGVEQIESLISEAHEEEMTEDELLPLDEYFRKWGVAMSERWNHLRELEMYVKDLKGMLSEKDFFNFSIKPIDSLQNDNDFIRVARRVKQRNDSANDDNIDRYLNNWRQNWNQYLRFIVKIAEHSEEISNIEETVRRIERFISMHNDARSIERISFEVQPGSENLLVKTSRDIKMILDRNGIDVNVVDVSDGVDTSLFTLESVPTHIRKQIVDHMIVFSHEVRQYKFSAIPPEDFFTIMVHMKEINKPEVQSTRVEHLGSTGTTITLKAILAVAFVGETMSTSKERRSAVHIFVDEFGRIDADNKRTISNLCDKFNIRLFSAEPEASKEKGSFDYGYSLYYDKLSHYRSGKIVKEKKREPKVIVENQ